jgi:poly(hydroxyalkanoate) granule-associated protein
MADDTSTTSTDTKVPFAPADFAKIQKEMTERGRDVWLAGLGALATVEEEGSKLFGQLVERGQAIEAQRREQVDEAIEHASKQQEQALSTFEKQSESVRTAMFDTFSRALQSFGVPTRREVDELNEKVDHLSKQVDKLVDALEKQ